jgi:GDP-D-mannose 3',5'-epimerase
VKKVIVTGGAGFIGGHLCKRLKDDGNYVVVYDRKMPEFGFAPADEYFIFDLRNSPDFYGSFRWQDASEVYQLAAEMGGAEYIFTGENDAEIMRSSALINLNVLEASRQAGIKKIFFASSACVYPSTPMSIYDRSRPDISGACTESDAGNPDSPYGLEKLFSESLYLAYGRNHGMDVRIGRFHNVFGSYGTWRGGREKAPAALMRKIAEAGQGGRIECFGDGEQTRSFLHVSEAVEGVVRLMASDFTGPVNIGSSEMVSINQMITMIKQIAGIRQLLVDHIPGPTGVRGRNSDNTLIEQKLGWKPSMSLRDGLEMTYPWIKEQVDKAAANK